MQSDLHLGVKDARFGLHDADSAVKGLDGVELGEVLAENRDQVQSEILGMHVGRETVR